MAYTLEFPSLVVFTVAISFFTATVSSASFLAVWLYTFPVFVSSYYIIYQSWLHPFYISPLRSVPTVPGFPLWGQTLAIITEEVGVPQRRWHKEHGPILRYFFFFGRARLSVLDDDALKQITVRNPYVWQKPPISKNIMVPILGEGVLLAEGDTHVQQRKALSPAFSISSIKTLSPIFWRKALLLSDLWRAELRKVTSQTSSIEVLDWFDRTTLDIIGDAGFGHNFDSLNHPETPIRKAYQRYFQFDNWDRLFHGLQSQTTLAKYLPMKAKHEILAARRTLIGVASDIIRDKQAKKQSHSLSAEKNIIAMIVRDNSSVSGKIEGDMTFETMRDQVMTFLGAGHDSTAVGTAWTLHLLAKHPSVQDKLRDEIRQHMPFLFSPHTRTLESHLSAADEDRLPYLANTCRESLRYIPPVPFTVRQNSAPDRLADHLIPAGTMTFMYANAINRAPCYWGPNADVFDPDRWDALPESYTANGFMTFIHGPRGCIGKKFAETEMKTVLCCLLSAYRFEVDDEVADPEDMKMWRITLKPRDGITLKVTPLEWNT